MPQFSTASALSQRTRSLLPRELATWWTISLLLSAVEGGLVGVLVKNAYAGVASQLWVNTAVALVSGAPAFANLLSLGFAAYAQGRDKVRLMSWMMVGCGLCLAVMGFSPVSPAGLLLLTVSMIVVRILWSGIVTLRASVWRTNFERRERAIVTGRVITLAGVIIGGGSGAIGLLLDDSNRHFHWLYPALALAGMAAAWVYSGTAVRRRRRTLQQERDSAGGIRIRDLFGIFTQDREFGRYLTVMMIFGSGNLMLMAPLIIVLNEHFELSRFTQVLMTSTIPLLLVSASVPLWARLLGGQHILQYRARQSWAFVFALGCFALAAAIGQVWLLWAGSAALGIAFGGAALGWNLGHNDYSTEATSALYMGAHVTLTGLRGLVMPLLGVAIYQGLSSVNPDFGRYALIVPFLLSAAGAIWFVLLAARQRRLEGGDGK